MKELVEYLVELYTTTLAPKIQQVITSGFQFFRLIETNPEAATQHAAAAIVTVVAIGLASFILIKAIVGISKTLTIASQVLRWLFDSIVEIAGNLRAAIQAAVLFGFPKLFTAQPYRALIYWAAMMDRPSALRMSAGFKDGPTQVRYQLNMGLAVLVLCAWSSLAFTYAVYAAGSSFDKAATGLGATAAIGGILYGGMILCLDRSIIAPYTRKKIEPDESIPILTRVASDLYRIAPELVKLTARVCIAVFVAGFTALPLTMLVLQGGIADEQNRPQAAARTAAEGQLRSAQDARTAAIAARQSSDQCRVATQAVADSQRRIDDMARAGCKDGQPTCPKKGTHYFETMHKGHVQNQQSACALNTTELRPLDIEVARLTAIVSAPPLPSKAADVLQGATVLEQLAIRQESNKYFKPVVATYYLLFIIELIPMLMKLWREPMVDRRSEGDRRATGEPPSGTERRRTGRRESDLYAVEAQDLRAA